MNPDENPPVGLILCTEKNAAVAHYALGNLGNEVLAREYKLRLPSAGKLIQVIRRKRSSFESGPAA